ncbi:MAG TPA: response regulator transcription factor [Vicinamibacterales bacterium]|jgi:two-component system alkaline phosphatase synthesis response regulator PhoP|nr:response regulator transcription factor [Vicinamibacterales bacterium]
MAESPVRSRVLVVEDEESIRDLISFHLDLAGFDCTTAADGKEALQLATKRPFDVLVLDVVLPTLDGITLCQAIRRDGPNREVPIMMLTARREESDKVVGLESGADDYLTKPFGIREFLARMNALMRRPRSTWRPPSAARGQSPISLLGITIDLTRRRVICDDRIVSLTPQEFNLLHLLASNAGVVFGREELLARVWHNDVFVTDRGVDTLVKRLRRKIEKDPSRPTRIITVWGAGYKFGEV